MDNDWPVSEDEMRAIFQKFAEMWADGMQFGFVDLEARREEIAELQRMYQLK